LDTYRFQIVGLGGPAPIKKYKKIHQNGLLSEKISVKVRL